MIFNKENMTEILKYVKAKEKVMVDQPRAFQAAIYATISELEDYIVDWKKIKERGAMPMMTYSIMYTVLGDREPKDKDIDFLLETMNTVFLDGVLKKCSTPRVKYTVGLPISYVMRLFMVLVMEENIKLDQKTSEQFSNMILAGYGCQDPDFQDVEYIQAILTELCAKHEEHCKKMLQHDNGHHPESA